MESIIESTIKQLKTLNQESITKFPIKQLKTLDQEFQYAIIYCQKSRLQFAFESKDESRFRKQELSARIKERTQMENLLDS